MPEAALETSLTPRPPYSLAVSARMRSDATRVFRDGVLTMVFEAGGAPALARVRQRPDGSLAVRLEGRESEAALELLRFVVAADEDHRPFLERFANDPLLAFPVRHLCGLRPLRAATVTHSLLRALCGQLVQARAARRLEARLLHLAAAEYKGLRLPPQRATFAGYATAELVSHGLAARKAAALVRLSRELELERLRRAPTEAVVARVVRERGLGPWSAGVICLEGLGRYEHGLVGDLGLIRLCASLLGRRAEAEDTADLLAPYGEWAGLASVYLLASLPLLGRGKSRAYARPRAGFSRSTAHFRGFSTM
jgi:DNA-3-methyladenine glycosylase II